MESQAEWKPAWTSGVGKGGRTRWMTRRWIGRGEEGGSEGERNRTDGTDGRGRGVGRLAELAPPRGRGGGGQSMSVSQLRRSVVPRKAMRQSEGVTWTMAWVSVRRR